MPDALRRIAAAALAVPFLLWVYVSAFGRARVWRKSSIVVAALAAPVLAWVYVSVAARTRAGRVGLISAAVLVGVAGFIALDRPDATVAQSPTEMGQVAAEDFRDVSLPTTARLAAADPAPQPPPGSADGRPPAAGSAQSSETGPEPPSAASELATASVASEPATASVGSEPPTASVASEPPTTPTPEPTPAPPTVVRFRPAGAATDVDRTADLSVRFSTAMDPASSPEFSASIDQAPIEGSFRWAEGDTVLVLDPADALPYGARVVLQVAAGARSAEGALLEATRAVSFTVESKPAPTPEPIAAPNPAPTAGPVDAPSAGSDVATASSAGWRWPLLGPITQRFGEHLTKYGFHYGLDIDGTTGDPVRAARAGTVVVAGYYDACGGLDVHIEHADGLVSWYRHLSRVEVAIGDRVDAGDLVGRVGNTGCSLGSHLHFAIRRGTTFLDPLDFLPAR